MMMAGEEIRQTSFRHRKKTVIGIVIVLGAASAALLYVNDRSGQRGANRQQAELIAADDGLASEPERDADIYGMITSVKGNQITILKFDPSTMPGAKKSDSSQQQTSTDENALSLGTSTTMPGGGASGGGMPSGGMPSRPSSSSGSGSSGGPGGMGGSGSSSSTREEKLEELKATSIGTETIMVPVGIPILVKSTDTDGMATFEGGNLTDLTSDAVVILWLEDADAEASVIEDEEAVLRVAQYINVTGAVDMDNSTK